MNAATLGEEHRRRVSRVGGQYGNHAKPRREIWSLFSGAMGLDLGLESSGLGPTIAVEFDRHCCKTIRVNKPDLRLLERDVRGLAGREMRTTASHDGEVFLMVGGPPCQPFSSGGKRAALSDPRGNLIYEFVRLVGEIRPKHFVLENVANIVTAAIRHRAIVDRPGRHWSLKRYSADPSSANGFQLDPDELSGTAIRQLLSDIRTHLAYRVTFGILDAADYGAAQHRLRFVMLGSREGPPPKLPFPTHGTAVIPFATVRDAIFDLQHRAGPHSEYTKATRSLFEMIPEGSNWRALSVENQKRALGCAWESGGGKTGFYRRLGWDKPSPTITGRANRKASGMCHPSENRPLSVDECARLQGFPDDWIFDGSMNRQYMQVGNAVPLALGRAIGCSILQADRSESTPVESDPSDSVMLSAAIQRLRNAARNKKSSVGLSVIQGGLFAQ